MPLPEKPPAVGRPEMWEHTTQPHTLCLAPLPHHLPNAIGPRPCQNSGPTFQAHVRARTRGSDCSLARSASLRPATYEQAREQHEAKPYYLRHPIRRQGSGSG